MKSLREKSRMDQCLRADGELLYPVGHECVSLVHSSQQITGNGPDECSRWQGPGLSPSLPCYPGHLPDGALEGEVKGGSQCLRAVWELWCPWGHERVDIVRCWWEITVKGPDERSGPWRWQSTKTRGRLTALGVPALECVIHM
jgi:hypothetical protein